MMIRESGLHVLFWATLYITPALLTVLLLKSWLSLVQLDMITHNS